MNERLHCIVDPLGTITFFRDSVDPITLAGHRHPIETMDMKRIAEFMESIGAAFNMADPIHRQAEHAQRLIAEAEAIKDRLLSAGRPVAPNTVQLEG